MNDQDKHLKPFFTKRGLVICGETKPPVATALFTKRLGLDGEKMQLQTM